MPSGYIGRQYLRGVAYYEFKPVPVKNRVYRYWYLRVNDAGVKRSIYVGAIKPDLSPLKALAAHRRGVDLVSRFRERRSPLPKPRRPGRGGRALARSS